MSEEQELIGDKISLSVLYFQAGDYQKALKLYDQLVSHFGRYSVGQLKLIRRTYGLTESPVKGPIIHPKLITVLDQRAATHEKLKNFDKAYADATKMVEMDPLSCKGYLRVGKLLMRRKQEKEALKVYRRGLSTIGKARQQHKVVVPENLLENLKKQYQLLDKKLGAETKENRQQKSETSEKGSQQKSQKMESKREGSSLSLLQTKTVGLQSRLDSMLKRSFSQTPPGSQTQPAKKSKIVIDLFEKLPLDLIEIIFRHLSIKNIISCHLVCRKWYSSLTNIPELYNDRIIFKNRITASEYADGMKLIKRIVSRSSSKQIKSYKLRSTLNVSQLSKILDSVVGDKDLKTQALDIINRDFSLEMFFGKLHAFNWNLVNINNITKVRFGINSSLKFPQMLFQIMPNLKSLEIIIIGSVLSRVNESMLPSSFPFDQEVTISNTLEVLSLVNHPELLKEHQSQINSSDTYDPFLPTAIFQIKFPALTSLTVVSYDFTDLETEFGRMLWNSPNLKMIYLEKNKGMAITDFLTLLRINEPQFVLEKLIIREKSITRAINLADYPPGTYACLEQLTYLDIYSSSLSIKGLMRLLKVCAKLRTLNIGNSNYIYFKNDKFSSFTKINLHVILEALPQLQKLYVQEMDLDNLTMKLFNQDLRTFPNQVRYLDLSFCTMVDGTGLMNLVNGIKLQGLSIDGVELNKNTLQYFTSKGIVHNISSDQFKTRWKQYGVNTLVPMI